MNVRILKLLTVALAIAGCQTSPEAPIAQRLDLPDPQARYMDDGEAEIAFYSVPVSSGEAEGPADAEVTAVAYVDLACPHSWEAIEALDESSQVDGSMRVAYRLYSRSSEGSSRLNAAGCAAQRQDRFEAFRAALTAHELASERDVMAAARGARLDLPRFGQDRRECESSLRVIRRDAQQLGVSSTPVAYVNGRRYARISDLRGSDWIQLAHADARGELANGVQPTALYAALIADGETTGQATALNAADLAGFGPAHGQH